MTLGTKTILGAWILGGWCLIAIPATNVNAAGSTGSKGTVGADFNADGIDDLAIGAPREDTGSEGFETESAGAVHVLYGSNSGLSASGNQMFTLEQLRPSSALESQFGSALAAGDFDGDNYDDLAIGAPRSDTGAKQATGSVYVLYGGPSGLDEKTVQFWSQAHPKIEGTAGEYDFFGLSLAAGDLGKGPQEDLVVGVLEGSTENRGGGINVLYGSAEGLTDVGDEFWDQDSHDIRGTVEETDDFGLSLAIGHFGLVDHEDLAIGIPGEDWFSAQGAEKRDAGAVAVLYGSASGLTPQANELFHQGTRGIPDRSQESDVFGFSLAAANFGRGTNDDLAVGAKWESNKGGSHEDEGAVTVLFGKSDGLTPAKSQFWHLGIEELDGPNQPTFNYSAGLTSGDFGKTHQADLAVTFLRTSHYASGAVNVIYGSAEGLNSNGNQIWHQGIPGIKGRSSAFEWFGSLASGDFGKSSEDDLAAGMGTDYFCSVGQCGALNLIYAKPEGLSAKGDQYWHQDSPGIQDHVEPGDGFGGS